MTKKLLITIIAGVFSLCTFAQRMVHIGKYDAEERKVLLEYNLGSNGIYDKIQNVDVANVDGEPYALNKDTRILYLKNEKGNYYVKLKKEQLKQWKDSGVPIVNAQQASIKVSQVNQELYNHYNALNEGTKKNQQQIAETQRVAQEQADKQRKEDNFRTNARKKRMNLPIGGLTLKCKFCNHEELNKDNLAGVYAVKDNKIFQITTQQDRNGIEVEGIHVYDIRDDLKDYSEFVNYLNKEEYYDGRYTDYPLSDNEIKPFNNRAMQQYREQLAEISPGISYTMEKDGSTLYLNITNTSKNLTIRSMEVIIPGNMDAKTFQLDGPIAPFETLDYELDVDYGFVPSEYNTTFTVHYSNGTVETFTP